MISPSQGKHVEDTWYLSALAVLGSTLALGAIATLLSIYNGTPIFKWHGVTLNAIVAVLAVTLKGLLAFAISDAIGQSKWIWFSRQQRPLQDLALIDSASRGPLGSLQLLYRSVARSPISIGAIVVVLSVAIDPFIQLAVGTTDTVMYKNDSSTEISYAKKYSRGYFTPLVSDSVKSTDGNTYFKARADADFAMKSAILYGVSQPDKLPNSPVTAFECGLWYCVNEYSSAVVNGSLVETSASAPSTRSPKSWQVLPLPEQPHFTVQQKIKNPPPDTLNYYEDSSSLLRTDLQLGAGFNLTQRAIYGIGKAMNETFLVTPAVNDTSGRTRFINSYILARGQSVTYHPTVMQALHNHPFDLDATFAALAKSMTNAIRGNGDDHTVATGQAGTYTVLFEVHWPYLILPATLALVGAAFLLTVIYRTRAAGIAVWGSDVMPSVALGARLGPIFDGDMRLSRMSGIAKLQSVQYPKLSEASEPVATENANGDTGYEMLTVDIGP
ncbi:MAG: hypothetical protein Q9224_005763 [Gallowayella concinna]